MLGALILRLRHYFDSNQMVLTEKSQIPTYSLKRIGVERGGDSVFGRAEYVSSSADAELHLRDLVSSSEGQVADPRVTGQASYVPIRASE